MTVTTTRQTTGSPDHSIQAGRLLSAVMGDPALAMSVGGDFTCGEANNIVEALALLDQREAAATFLAAHARGDDIGDEHGTFTALRAATQYVLALP
jgi:hypothetical protein